MTSYYRLFPFFWIIGIVLAFFYHLSVLPPVQGTEAAIDTETIDLGIETTFSLSNMSYIEFERSFTLSQKREIYLIEVKCQSSENCIEKVIINATLNGVITKKTFWDSTQNYSAFHSFFAGSTLNLKLNESSPIFYLSNLLKLTFQVECSSVFQTRGDFIIEKVVLKTLTPPTITSATTGQIYLPLEASEGQWYIPPLSILLERSLHTRIFTHIPENIRLQLSLEVIPLDLPLSAVSIIVSTNQNSVQSGSYTRNEPNKVVFVDIKKGEELNLEVRFRPSTETKNNILKFSIGMTAALASLSSNENIQEESPIYDIIPVQLSILEFLRIACLVIPLFMFYKHRKNATSTNQSLSIKEISEED